MKKANRTRLMVGGAIVALGLAGFGAYSASAGNTNAAPAQVNTEAENKNTTSSTHLTIAAATKAAQATLDAAKKENQRVSVAIVDRNGNTILTLRGDGAGPQSY
ncbi:heme-binding protein, partial [Streptomyces termitum]|uniref:heme-binding protein n=1 Tax=Streptomyces termitum TaxID=67368 RepID=UPI0033AB55E4